MSKAQQLVDEENYVSEEILMDQPDNTTVVTVEQDKNNHTENSKVDKNPELKPLDIKKKKGKKSRKRNKRARNLKFPQMAQSRGTRSLKHSLYRAPSKVRIAIKGTAALRGTQDGPGKRAARKVRRLQQQSLP